MRKIVYFDNASVCPVKKEVIKFARKNIANFYASSNTPNYLGSVAKAEIEQARNSIAGLFRVSASQIRFTSGGTESNNLACNFIDNKNTKAIITSKYEHNSVLETLKRKSQELNIPLFFVEHDSETGIDLKKLSALLNNNKNSFVSLAHVNRLTGRLLQIKRICVLCHKNNSVFHSDMSQTMGKFNINLDSIGIDIATASARNFGAIAGAGIIYSRKKIKLSALFAGDDNEYGLRPGAENILAIGAMEEALRTEYKYFDINKNHYLSLQKYLFDSLDKQNIKYKSFATSQEHFAAFINLVSFHEVVDFESFLIKLDINNVMIGAIEKEQINEKSYIRIFFYSGNSKKEIKMFVNSLTKIIRQK